MCAERVDDQVFHHEGILERILNQIDNSDLIVAEMTKPNPNVFYEVGYAHAKSKLCILLTKDANTIPFDLKSRRHIVYSSIQDLKTKLARDLEVIQGETELSFDPNSPGCVDEVPVYVHTHQIVGQSRATSIRVKVETNARIPPKNVTAFISKIEKGKVDGSWEEISISRDIQTTWTDTNNTITDLASSAPKYVNVLHIDHNENLLTIWQTSMPPSLVDFFKDTTTYRLTVSVVAQGVTRHTRIELDWKGKWDTIQVRSA
jgi:hypothetical protein